MTDIIAELVDAKFAEGRDRLDDVIAASLAEHRERLEQWRREELMSCTRHSSQRSAACIDTARLPVLTVL